MIVKDKNFDHFDDVDVENYIFSTFPGSDDPSPEKQEYKMRTIRKGQFSNAKEKKEKLLNENKRAQDLGFKLSPIVKEYRGHKEFEVKESIRKIEEEVKIRVNDLTEEARQEGYEAGFKQGREDSILKLQEQSEDKLARLMNMISEVVVYKQEIINQQKNEIYKIIRDLTKWIILRELKNDDDYVNRLLEKLVLEMGEKSNLNIHINQEQFEDMPEVLEKIQEKLGELKNVRTIVNYDLGKNGLKLESENGLIVADLDEQFKSLDKMFEGVLIGTEEETGEDDGNKHES